MNLPLLLSCLIAAVTLPAPAQTVWRCGPDGSSYRASPCGDGHSLALDAAPGAEAVAEARGVVEHERMALQTLAAERHAREAEALRLGLGPAGIRPAPVVRPVAARPRKSAKGKPPAPV